MPTAYQVHAGYIPLFSVASRSMSASTSALTGGRPVRLG